MKQNKTNNNSLFCFRENFHFEIYVVKTISHIYFDYYFLSHTHTSNAGAMIGKTENGINS